MREDDSILLVLVSVLGLLAFTLARRTPENSTGELETETPAFNDDDVDRLARLVWAETSGFGPVEERESIVQVALNRAQSRGVSIAQVATPPGRPLWNGSSIFVDRWNSAPTQSNFGAARDVAIRVLSGEAVNRIGPREQFVHPGGSPPCANQSACRGRRLCRNGRCIPVWSVSISDGGNAPHEPVNVGRGIFS